MGITDVELPAFGVGHATRSMQDAREQRHCVRLSLFLQLATGCGSEGELEGIKHRVTAIEAKSPGLALPFLALCFLLSPQGSDMKISHNEVSKLVLMLVMLISRDANETLPHASTEARVPF